MIMKYLLFLLSILMNALLFCGCIEPTTEAESEGGSGSEVVGKAEYSDTAVAMARPSARSAGQQIPVPVIKGGVFVLRENFQADVLKRPESYVPDVYTDSSGRFFIASVNPGTYILEVDDYQGKAVAVRFRVDGSGDPIDLGTLLADESATLRYHITTDIPNNVTLNYAVYVLGSRVSTSGDNNKLIFNLGGIAYGPSYSVKIQVNQPVSWSRTFTGISFQPGQILDLEITLPDWY
jgi:hypothetical protein